MCIPVNFLVGCLGADTDDSTDISSLSSCGVHVEVSWFEGDGMLDEKFVIRVMRSNIE